MPLLGFTWMEMSSRTRTREVLMLSRLVAEGVSRQVDVIDYRCHEMLTVVLGCLAGELQGLHCLAQAWSCR